MTSLLWIVTDLGDSLLLGACVMVVAICLMLSRCRKEAFTLCAAFFLTSATIAFMKIVCIGCFAPFPWLTVRSPSGHSALSLAVFGTMALIIARRVGWIGRFVVWTSTILLAGTIAYSRVLLGMHLRAEVLIGLGVGGVAIWLAAIFLKHQPTPPIKYRPIVIVLAAVIFILYGDRAPAEGLIKQIAAEVNESLTFCQAEE